MSGKPTYEELESKVKLLEQVAAAQEFNPGLIFRSFT